MHHFLKRAGRLAARIIVVPAVICFWLGSYVIGRQKSFAGWSQAMSLIPGLAGVYLRRAFYSSVLQRCGDDACIQFGTIFSHPHLQIGCKVYVGAYCVIGDVTLDDDVLVGSQVSITNGSTQHGIQRLDVPIREQPGQWPRITIGRDTWIGDRAVVMADVGEHSVIGAGSVVNKPIPAFAVAVGCPARIIRDRREVMRPTRTAHGNETNAERLELPS
jgi:acetyltransferase-like isoleucine patch superfamily enzyme